MAPVLGADLVGKSVMTSDGKLLGELYNITMGLDTGELDHLIVEPDGNVTYDERYSIDNEGRYLVPSDQVQGLSDYITVEPSSLQ